MCLVFSFLGAGVASLFKGLCSVSQWQKATSNSVWDDDNNSNNDNDNDKMMIKLIIVMILIIVVISDIDNNT